MAKVRTSTDEIKKPQIRRLALREGIDSVSASAFDQIRSTVNVTLQDLLRVVNAVMHTVKRKTVGEKDVRVALRILGKHLAVSKLISYSIPDGGKRKKLNSIRSDAAKSALVIDRSTFSRLVRRTEMPFTREDARFSQEAISLLHVFTENHLHELLVDCAFILKQQGRSTLDHTHILAARSIGSSNLVLRPTTALSIDETKNKNRLTANTASEILRDISPDAGIDASGKAVVNQIVTSVVSRLLAIAHALVIHESRQTVNSRSMQGAVRILFPPELSVGANNASVVAVTKFNAYYPDKKAAGLTVSISRVEHMIRTARTAPRVGVGAPVYLAGTIDYLLKQLLEAAQRVSRENKKVRVTSEHIAAAIEGDDEMRELFGTTITGIAL